MPLRMSPSFQSWSGLLKGLDDEAFEGVNQVAVFPPLDRSSPMKDLNSLKKELKRLADVDVLKKELNRIAGEIKTLDVHVAISPKAKQRLNKLERRFRELMKRLTTLQKDVDRTFSKFMTLVRRTTGTATARKSARKSPAKKKTSRRAATTRKAAN